MEHYEELLEQLRNIVNHGDEQPAEYCTNRCGGCDACDKSIDAIETLLAERDALYKLAKRCPMQNAKECSHYDECFKDAYDNMCIMRCASCVSWQWRGPQKHD